MAIPRSCLVLLWLIASFFTSAAFGDNFQLTASGGGVDLSAILTATPTGTPDQFLVTGITGTYNGSTLDGLIPGGPSPTITPSGQWEFDNLLYTGGGPIVDYWGLGFYLSGGVEANLFNNPPYTFGYGTSANGTFTELYPTDVSLTAVPEPSSLMLLGGAALGLLGPIRRKLLG
jgi:hypothetical protein